MKTKTKLILLIMLTTALSAKEFTYPSVEFIQPMKKNSNSKVIILDNNFEKVRDLHANQKLFNTARRIASIGYYFKGSGYHSYCSGSLVGPDLILTNHHCLFDGTTPLEIKNININMEYLQTNQIKNYQATVTRVIKKDRKLDYALLKLDKPIGKHYGWLELADNTPNKGDVMVIQHPRGRSKEVSRINSRIIQNNSGLLHYFADTEGGSSGSPVFNLKGRKIIALHHAGNCQREKDNPEDETCIGGSYNEGIIIAQIKQQIQQYLPSCAIDGDFPGEFVNKCVYLTE